MTDGKTVDVIGAGGHAKVVVATVQAAGLIVRAVWDDDQSRWGGTVLGVPIQGPVAAVPDRAAVVVAVGSNEARKAIVSRLVGREFVSVIHPTAIVHPTATVGRGTVVFAGGIVQPQGRLGEHVIVNTSASVDHDCLLEDFVHVAPGVRLAGNVSVREGAFLGVGVSAVPGAEIGAWATVGAGAVVVRSIPPRVIAVGCPARALRKEQEDA